MGAALLSKPETVREILTTLVRNIPRPITCKIRLLKTTERTIDLVKLIEQTGVSAIAVHCRTINERPRDPAHWDQVGPIVSAVSIPVIANGDIRCYEDILHIKQETGCSSVMIGRGAIKNTSIFQAQGPRPRDDVLRDYIKIVGKLLNLCHILS